jgi:hypothetical protein
VRPRVGEAQIFPSYNRACSSGNCERMTLLQICLALSLYEFAKAAACLGQVEEVLSEELE